MNDLGKDSIRKLLFNLATPAIIAQIVNVLYNIVYRIFIGRLNQGEVAMAGIGVTLPIILIITAFSSLFGMGGAPLCAIQIGAGNKENAERILTGSWSMLTMTGIMLTGVILLFAKPLLWLFGASNATIVYASDYLSIYLFGTVFVQTAVGMNPFINTQGFAKFGMLTVVIGALVNLILDPILIFGLNMGVKGAALATIIAQGVSATWVISFLRGKRSKLHLRVRYLIPSRKIASHVIGLGISPFIMQSTESLVLISLNTQLVRFGGDIAIGSMTIMNSILQVINLPMQGIAQGAQPIISFNYGANQLERVRDTIKLAFKVALSYNILLCGILMLFPSVFVKIFNDHPELVATTSRFIRIYFIGFSIFGAQIIAQQTFVALGQAKISIFIATLRKLILLIPLVYIMPHFFTDKVTGVLVAEPVSDLISVATAVSLFIYFYRRKLHE